MGRVVVTFRILPEDAETDLQGLRGRIQEAFRGQLSDVREEPFAFGLVALEAALLLEDAAGAADRSEAVLRGLEGVRSVETLSVDLL